VSYKDKQSKSTGDLRKDLHLGIISRDLLALSAWRILAWLSYTTSATLAFPFIRVQEVGNFHWQCRYRHSSKKIYIESDSE
jgi:hypothetical protein